MTGHEGPRDFGPDPCWDCRLFTLCRDEKLACGEFSRYVATGSWNIDGRVRPSSGIYVAVFREDSDSSEMAEVVAVHVRTCGMSSKAIARATGLSSATITKIANGNKPGPRAYLVLSRWILEGSPKDAGRRDEINPASKILP